MILVAAKVSRHLARRDLTVLPIDTVLVLSHIAPGAHISIRVSAIVMLAEAPLPIGVFQSVVGVLESLVPEQAWLSSLECCPVLRSSVICTIGCETF